MSFLGVTGTSVLGGFSLIHFFVHSPRSTSGATFYNLLAAGIAAGYSPTCISRGGNLLRFEQAITQTEGERVTIVPATQLELPY